MNTDIRLSISFWDHPKTVKLERRLGLEGVKSLQILWMWVATNRPSGDLTEINDRSTTVQRMLNDEDIEIAARWNGEENKFINTLVELGWINKTGDGYIIHGWKEHNSWASCASGRGDKARFSRMAKTHPVLYLELKNKGVTSITSEEYDNAVNDRSTTVQRDVNASLTPSPSPSPSPKVYVRFSPPSVNDVREYCFERKNSIDPELFVDHYQARGWALKTGQMKDWKAAIRTWEKNGVNNNRTVGSKNISVKDALTLQSDEIARALNHEYNQQQFDLGYGEEGRLLVEHQAQGGRLYK